MTKSEKTSLKSLNVKVYSDSYCVSTCTICSKIMGGTIFARERTTPIVPLQDILEAVISHVPNT